MDGWGFYRTEVEVPEEWRDQPLFLDIEQRKTAFELRISFPLPVELTPEGQVEIGVRVYDWQGVGGDFPPGHPVPRADR